MPAKVIGFVQSKGGVGKTSLALHLAAELGRRGHRVLLVDADPSASATMVAASGHLKFPVEPRPVETVEEVNEWARRIKQAEADYVLVDAPGAMGVAYGGTIALANLVIVPSGSTVLDLRGAADTIGVIRKHKSTMIRRDRPLVLVVPSRIDRRTIAGRDVGEMLAPLNQPVGPAITYKAAVADFLAAGLTVPPSSPSGVEFAALADAVLSRLGDIT